MRTRHQAAQSAPETQRDTVRQSPAYDKPLALSNKKSNKNELAVGGKTALAWLSSG
jgi:hypothetical protein